MAQTKAPEPPKPAASAAQPSAKPDHKVNDVPVNTLE
jgi:hypothetical protein